jgi:uncharacterized protein YjbI with pentapeptide repeats
MANLFRSRLCGTKLHLSDLSGADLAEADLQEADLSKAILANARLQYANLRNANLSGADLRESFLDGANLFQANLCDANLERASFCGASLIGANLLRANLIGTRLTEARLGSTVFGNNDLTEVIDLHTCEHRGPSYLDVRTIYTSRGQLPLQYSRGVGLADDFIALIPGMVGEGIEFYECFISYASNDEDFTRRLHADLQDKGIRCWFAPHDLKIGERIRSGIDEAIRIREKLILVLSSHSVASQWVEQEVETALEEERQRGANASILFPIRLDDAVMDIPVGWPKLIRNTRNIGDFTLWRNHNKYSEALKRVIHDLRKGTPS